MNSVKGDELICAILGGKREMDRVVSAHLGGRPLLLSGAAEGADTAFGEAAMEQCGHEVAHILGPSNRPSEEATRQQSHTLVGVSDQVLQSPIVDIIFRKCANSRLSKAALETAHEDCYASRRNILQVKEADSVYAVAYRLPPSDDTPRLDVGGGTGFACECYVNRFVLDGEEDPSHCRLYLFDDGDPAWPGCLKDPATHRKWSQWEPQRKVWTPLYGQPPTPSGVYAGIGATRLTDWGLRAIKELFERAHPAAGPAARV